MTYDKIVELIGEKEEYLFSHKCETILKENLHLPSHRDGKIYSGSAVGK